MARRRAGRKEAAGPPQDKPWTWITADLICSPAWRSLSINARRLIDFLLKEHMAHGGAENGNLAAPYAQLVTWGIGRRLIAEAIEECEIRGLISVRRGSRKGVKFHETSRFRITFLPTREKEPGGFTIAIPPGDEWRGYVEAPK